MVVWCVGGGLGRIFQRGLSGSEKINESTIGMQK